MVDSRVYRWADGTFVEDDWCDPHSGRVLVADSWLVVDGTSVALERHLARFTNGAAETAPDADAARFARDALPLIPQDGNWFPRIEAVDYGDAALLRLHVRPAPQTETTITLASAQRDPRTNPRVKGPDLAALGALRRETGTGEAVIVDDGRIAEGAWSSLLWWIDDTLHVVSPAIPRLASVTESVVRDIARQYGAPVIESATEPSDLDGAEVWSLSALHGIRVATEWVGGPALTVEPGRAEFWRQAYRVKRERLPEI